MCERGSGEAREIGGWNDTKVPCWDVLGAFLWNYAESLPPRGVATESSKLPVSKLFSSNEPLNCALYKAAGVEMSFPTLSPTTGDKGGPPVRRARKQGGGVGDELSHPVANNRRQGWGTRWNGESRREFGRLFR